MMIRGNTVHTATTTGGGHQTIMETLEEAIKEDEAPVTTAANKATKKMCVVTRRMTKEKRLEVTITTQDATTMTMMISETTHLHVYHPYVLWRESQWIGTPTPVPPIT